MRATTLFALLLHAGASAADGQGMVHGIVRSDATGVPIAGARVELRERAETATARTDRMGFYELRGVPAGTHRLRFAAHGHDSLAVDVLLLGDAPLRLDIFLSPEPAALSPVRVVGRAVRRRVERSYALGESGAWSISGEAMRRSPALDDADPVQILATVPQAQVLPEAQVAVHVRGGSADQNQFLLDGAPVLSPSHSGTVPSAFSPDIVEELVLHGGAPSARYGGRLSSVIDVRTPSGVSETASARGAFGPTSLRVALRAPLVPGHVGLLVAARHGYAGLRREEPAESGMPGAWADLFGKLTIRVAGDEVTLSSFTSENGLGFAASASDETGAPTAGERRNRFDWATTTQALAWTHPIGARGTLETRAWRARLDVTTDWRPDGDAVAMRSAVRDDGVSAAVTLPHARGILTGGVEAERLAASYEVAPIDGPRDGSSLAASPEPLLRRSAAPTIHSAFVEEAWRPLDAWTLGAGVRAAWIARGEPRLEPRLAVAYRPSARIGLSVGYARLHQYVQSLRNEESVLGTVVAPDLLVASDTRAVPVASSNELAVTATLDLDAHTTLRLDGYARRLGGLVLVAPGATDPFATRDYVVGRGAARGVSLTIERQTDALHLQGSYAIGGTTRSGATGRYHPAFAPGQSASLAIDYRLGDRTSVRSALWAASGRRTTPVAGGIEWDTRDAFSGVRELGGTPRVTGPLGGTRLPPFLRVDVGIRRTLAEWRPRGSLAGYASVSNVLGRANAMAYALATPAGARRALLMLPPSLLAGLTWQY